MIVVNVHRVSVLSAGTYWHLLAHPGHLHRCRQMNVCELLHSAWWIKRVVPMKEEEIILNDRFFSNMQIEITPMR
jgi:hypothetical protein